MTNPDQSLIDGLTKRLKVEPSVSMDFSYGQLRRAASFVVKECGYEWALKVSVVHELREHRSFRRKIKNFDCSVISSLPKFALILIAPETIFINVAVKSTVSINLIVP